MFAGSAKDKLEFMKRLCENDFKPVEEKLLSVFGLKRLPKRDTDQIIEGMIAESDIDFENKVRDRNYYYCSASAISIVLKHIFPSDFMPVLEVYNENPQTRFFTDNYWEILKCILLDVNDLENLYNNEIRKCTRYVSSIRGRKIHTVSLHQVLRQGLFGSVSAHSFADKEISAAIGTIRQLIELRLRRAFGLLAYVDTQQKNSVIPLNMSDIFNALDMFSEDIKFPLKLKNIKRIYSWSNRFIHGGYGDYNWIPFFIDFAFRDFTFGHEEKNGFDMNNGIETTNETISLIQRCLIEKMNDGKCNNSVRYRLLSSHAECKIKPEFTAEKAEIPVSASGKIKSAWQKLSIFCTHNGCFVVCGSSIDDSIAFPNEYSLLDWLEANIN